MINPRTWKLTLLATALALLVAFVARHAAVSADDQIEVLETKEYPRTALKVYEKRAIATKGGEFKVIFVVVDPRSYQVRLAVPSEPAAGGSSLARFFSVDNDAVAVLNGGFLRTSVPATPAGLLKYEGQILNRLSYTDPVLGGLLCFIHNPQGTDLQLAERADAQLVETANDCLQSGPLLVHQGVAHDDLEKIDREIKDFSAGFYMRSFVTTNKRNQILLGITSPISLFALRRIMLMSETDGGLDAAFAIGLTGLDTAGFIVRGRESFIAGNVNTLLPNAIVVAQAPRRR
jgi:hypothetical protein